jgi:type IV pilus assembly protein PilW
MSHLTHSNGYRSRARGVTLVELMVAMTLALAIVAAVGYVYLQGKQGFSVQDNRSRLQENARLAFSVMSRDILMSGYFGCVKSSVDSNIAPPIGNIRITAAQPLMKADIGWIELDGVQATGTRFLSAGMAMRGYDSSYTGVWPVENSLRDKRFAGTDTLLLLRGGDDSRHLSENSTQTTFTLTSALPNVKDNAYRAPLVISNCTRGEIIKPDTVGGITFSLDGTYNQNRVAADATVDGKLRYAPYETGSMVTTFEPAYYYVALAKGSEGRLVPSLHRLKTHWKSADIDEIGAWDDNGEVVMQGVERLQVRFYVAGATDGSSLGPYTSAEVTTNGKWLSVVAVEVELTMVSDDNNMRTLQTTQTVGGNSLTDNRIRLTTSFTVNVRNPKE